MRAGKEFVADWDLIIQALRTSSVTSLTASCALVRAGESPRVSTTASADVSRDRLLCPRCDTFPLLSLPMDQDRRKEHAMDEQGMMMDHWETFDDEEQKC